ncbi:MAG: PHP domain-containing protein [Clostridia bacterium]|nr:PHP domain-containing protein [Clostridia bacterium]
MDSVDFHIHTNHSQKCEFSVEDILRRAQKSNLEYISFTDHGTTEAYKDLESINTSDIYAGKIITGIEINCLYKDMCIDIVGYKYKMKYLEDLNKWLKEKISFEKTAHFQQEQLEYLIKALKKYNLILPENKKLMFNEKNVRISKDNEFAGFVFAEELLKYKENLWLFEGHEGILNSPGLFFKVFCCDINSPFYVDIKSYKPKLKEVIDIIHKCGGLIFVPHPTVYFKDDESLIERFLNDIVTEYEIDGIECYHPDVSLEQREFLLDFCNSKNLKISGGTDFHDDSRVLGLLDGYKITSDNMNWIYS